MIHSVTLSLIDAGNHSTMLDGKYFDKETGQTITLLTNWGVAIEKAPGLNEQKWIQWFKPNTPTLPITWDDTKENGPKIANFVKYLKRHSSVKCDGNTNCVSGPQFKLTDSRQVHVERAEGIKTKLTVGNLIKGMKTSEMMDVAYLVGANPTGKTTEQIFVELCDFDLGKCMVNPTKFLSDWNLSDRSLTVYARKAVELKVITMDNQVYKFNNTTIGGTMDEIVLFLKNNPETFDSYIRKQIDDRDLLPVAVSEDVLVSDIIDKKAKVKAPELPNNRMTDGEKASNRAVANKAKEDLEQKRQALIGEAKLLGVKGAQMADKGGWSIEALEKKIAEKKKETELVVA